MKDFEATVDAMVKAAIDGLINKGFTGLRQEIRNLLSGIAYMHQEEIARIKRENNITS